MTNTREVRCDTVLMGGRRVTQPHRVTSLFVAATAHFRRGRSSHWLGPPWFGTPLTLHRLLESVGKGSWTMSKAQHSKPDLPCPQEPRSALAAGWTPAPGNPSCSLAT